MIALTFTLAMPVMGAIMLAFIRSIRVAGWVNVGASAGGFAGSMWLASLVVGRGQIGGGQFYVDSFNVYLISLTAFVGLTTSIFSRPYMAHELTIDRLTGLRLQLYHASFQGFLFTMLLALSTNNLGILWEHGPQKPAEIQARLSEPVKNAALRWQLNMQSLYRK